MRARTALRVLAIILLALCCASAIKVLFGPWFREIDTYGFHDWDTAASYRIETVWALRQGAFPFWDPFLCGGFPAWGYAEGTPNLISPFLPAYLALPLPLALRIEGVGATLIALAGAYGFASCHARSVALRGLVAVLFALNGRWALQIAVGHAWHLAYAWMPFVLWAYERSLQGRRPQATIAGAALLALIGYLGGIYPLPHTALALVVYALGRAVAARDTLPLRRAALLAALGVGFFAPKLVPVLFTMARFPRWIDSVEAIGLADLWVMLTARSQGVSAKLLPGLPYGWHEWGIYLGWLGVAALSLSLLALISPRGRALLAPALLLFVLGFGATSALAPWALLHELPPFRAQHVPSRFFFPAVLLLATAAAHGLGRLVDGLLARRQGFDLAATFVVGWLALDLASVGARASDRAFHLHAPAVAPTEFHHADRPRLRYVPNDAWGGAALLSREANEGVLRCAGAPEGAEPRGAVADDDPRYRGEAFLLEGAPGTARVVRRAPNEIDVEASGPGLLVVNMNFDPGWQADGQPARDQAHALAATVEPGHHIIHFRYRPRGLWPGLGLFALALAAAVALGRPRRPA